MEINIHILFLSIHHDDNVTVLIDQINY